MSRATGLTRVLILMPLLLAAACTRSAGDPPAAAPAAMCLPRVAAPPPPQKLSDWALGARLFENLGTHHRAITTSSAEAQRWFDQGLRLVWAFNHDEATRAFVKAATLDPSCASCWWGAALTLGPNYNVPMLPDRAQAAWDALGKARQQAARATPVEQALIAALAQRYRGPEALDPAAMQPYQEAYAQAMRAVARQFPDDTDVQVLSAEAQMNLNPWKLWSLDGEPAPGTNDIVRALEAVLATAPTHPGANHYYIHAVEASPTPQRALPSAERLAGLMRGAGHIVHMPAHIFQRVGRYADAERANRDGAAADLAYLQRVAPQGYYAMYLAHNYDFQAYSAAMRGRAEETLAAQRRAGTALPAALLDGMPGMDFFAAKTYFGLLRFGRYAEILATPAPAEKYPVWYGVHLYAQAYAQAALGEREAAATALRQLQSYAGRLPADLPAGYNSAKDVLNLGALLVEARLAQQNGDTANAIQLLQRAVAAEDRLAYDEPSDWFFPVRHQLGAVLLAAGRGKDAEAVYREDLRRHPHNGWALFGLAASLRAQQRESREVRDAFASAWRDADVTLTASAY